MKVLKTEILKKFPEVVNRETLFPRAEIMRDRLASGIPIYIDEDYYATFDTFEVVDEKNIGHYATWRDWQTYTLRQNDKGEKCYIVTGGSMNKLDVENIAIFAHHLKELRDKITTAKIIHDSRAQRMAYHRILYPNMDEKNRKKVLLDIERKEVKKVEQEYSEAFSAGYKIGLILPFGCIEIKKYINS